MLKKKATCPTLPRRPPHLVCRKRKRSKASHCILFFFFQAEDGIRDFHVTGVQTCALPIYGEHGQAARRVSGAHRRLFAAERMMRRLLESCFTCPRRSRPPKRLAAACRWEWCPGFASSGGKTQSEGRLRCSTSEGADESSQARARGGRDDRARGPG